MTVLNIVVPMAGLGSRFTAAGYTVPKPLIPVHDVPMIKLVIANVRPSKPHRFIFICQRAHANQYGLGKVLAEWTEQCSVIELDGITEGAACTVLDAESFIDNDSPLMIVNSDQFVDIDINEYLSIMEEQSLDGLIMTMDANDPKWSYAAVDDAGLVARVVEKQPISRHATVGIYNFARGRDFVAAARNMIRKNLRVNNEYYVAPVYNEMIAAGARVGVFGIGRDGAGMYGLGTPYDLTTFLSLPLSKRVTKPLRG